MCIIGRAELTSRCQVNQAIIDSDNGLSPLRHHAIIRNNICVSSISTIEKESQWYFNKNKTFFYKKMSSAKCWAFRSEFNVLSNVKVYRLPQTFTLRNGVCYLLSAPSSDIKWEPNWQVDEYHDNEMQSDHCNSTHMGTRVRWSIVNIILFYLISDLAKIILHVI